MMYWISWYQPTEDYRPRVYPPNPSILGYWCTGQRSSDGASTLVAWVEAGTEEIAKEYIQIDWPEATEWRFCNVVTEWKLSTRFPLSDWMERRIEAAKSRVRQAKVLDDNRVIDVGYGLSLRFRDGQVWLDFDTVTSNLKASINMDAYADSRANIVSRTIKNWCDEMRQIRFRNEVR